MPAHPARGKDGPDRTSYEIDAMTSIAPLIANQDISPIHMALEGIGHVLRDQRLSVPPYQRRYSWDEEEVSDFWWDLKAAFGATRPEYFLGAIVLNREVSVGVSDIIDGQQRLTTASLLLLAIRNEFYRRGDTSRAQVIEREYGITQDLRSGAEITRLVLNTDDQVSYIAEFAHRPIPEQAGAAIERQTRLGKAMQFLETQVQQEAKNAGPHWGDVLFRWVDFMDRRARVINVSVASMSDAFLIFESLNARGKALTVADLLKNYLFGIAGPDLNLIQSDWLSALRALEASADEEVFTTYLRHLWTSTHGLTRERDLYARMKAAITARPVALSFGKELERSAPLYAALLSTDQPYWAEHAEIQPLAETLLRLNLEQNRPLLLAAMRHFDGNELAKLIRAVICWSVRGLVVGGLGGGTIERAYGEAAVAVTEGRAITAATVYDELANVIPTDEVFRQAFAIRRINRTTIAKYFLVALTRYENGDADPLVVPDAVETTYQLQSILPRRANLQSWPNFSADAISEFVFRIGNLFVTAEQSEEPMPKGDQITPADWSPEAIMRRQQALADLVIDLWPRRPQ